MDIIFRKSFKSCPRKGASAKQKARLEAGEMFQVMPPQGGIIVGLTMKAIKVSSHAPARGHLLKVVGVLLILVFSFQVMPPQGGICIVDELPTSGEYVSSHAPARGHRYWSCFSSWW